MERREFIGAGVAGAAMLGAAALSQEGGAVKEVKVALIGCGVQGRVLMSAMLKIPGVKFVAVCDIWAYSQRYASRSLMKFGHEVKVYDDYQKLLENEDEVEACVIATPDVWHAPITVAALKAGKQVYCEKNMSNTIEGARQMVQAMKETGQLLQIGHQRRSNPRYLAAKALHEEHGIFGRLMYSNAQWNRGVTEPNTWPSKYEMTAEELAKWGYESMEAFRNWRWFKKHGGGPICDLGAHQIDIFNWFFGCNPSSVLASGGKDFYEEFEWYDNIMTIYEFPTEAGMARAFYQVLTTTSSLGFLERFMGTEATLAISELPRWNQFYREISIPEPPDWTKHKEAGLLVKPGEDAEADATNKDAAVDARLAASPAPEKWDIPVKLEKPLHQPHLENFFGAVRGENELTCPGDVAFPTAVTVLKVNEAVETGRKLELTDADFTA